VIRHVPNILGLGRVLAAPALAWCILGGALEPAFWIFLLAGLSDALDGAIARRFDAVTLFGALLDPVADKILISSAYLSAAVAGLLPGWLAAIVFARDAAIALVAVLTRLFGPETVFPPSAIGKLGTGAQVALGCYALAVAAFGWPGGVVLETLALVVAAFTLISGIGYAAVWLRGLRTY